VSRSTKDGARGRRRTRAAITGEGEPGRVGGEYPVRDPAGAEMADGKHRAHHRAAEERGGGDDAARPGGTGRRVAHDPCRRPERGAGSAPVGRDASLPGRVFVAVAITVLSKRGRRWGWKREREMSARADVAPVP